MNTNLVGKVEVRVVNWVEAGTILRGVGVGQRGDNGVGGSVDLACILLRHRLPLARRWIEAKVTVRSHAYTILDD